MSLAEKYMTDPLLVPVSNAVNEALRHLAQSFECEAQLQFYEATANIAVDKMTELILRCVRGAELGA